MNDTDSAATSLNLDRPRSNGSHHVDGAATAVRRRNRRAAFLHWVRKTHGWFGLWGATLGLLFGISGIWLNHRAVLKLPPVAQQRSNTQIALPDPAPADAQALAVWLQTALHLDAPATSVRVEPARPVPWAERPAEARPAEPGGRGGSSAEKQAHVEPGRRLAETGASGEPASVERGRRGGVLMQPEHWTINFGGPRDTLQAESWAGNRSVGVRRVESGVIGTLMNLHKGIGMPVAWILLVDTLAGSLILLSISGLVLWLMTHRRRAVGIAIFGLGCALTVGLALSRV